MKKMKKESYYMIIPASVWNADLKHSEVICYGHISVLANKNGYCHANNKYFEKVLNASTATVGRYLKKLEEIGVITRKIYFESDGKTVKERRIYLNTAIITDDNSPIITSEHSPIITSDQDNSTSNNNTRTNTIDDDYYGKIFFKIVDAYPKNRIGNRQHGLKKFKQLSKEEAKLVAINLKRYLNLAGTYVKSLQNYITEECWSEDWLKAEETKNNKLNKTNPKHNIPNNYDNID